MSFKYSLNWLEMKGIQDKQALLHLLKDHDQKSYEYSLYVAMLNDALGMELGMEEEERYAVFLCGLFHDIGKLGMDKSFIHYPDSYSKEMIDEMKKHVTGGVDLLSFIEADPILIDAVRHHHTNYDGSGYPGGKVRKGIPLYARMTRISDSADAYMTNRSYKAGGPIMGLKNDLSQFEGSWYDPYILDHYFSMHERITGEAERRGVDSLDKEVYMRMIFDLYAKDSFERFLQEWMD
ncbi:hypothetical protein bcgnr5390_17110 [Bacillus luti]|nr:hypothetical protein BC2903_54370 [Bacillus cereus]